MISMAFITHDLLSEKESLLVLILSDEEINLKVFFHILRVNHARVTLLLNDLILIFSITSHSTVHRAVVLRPLLTSREDVLLARVSFVVVRKELIALWVQ